MRRTRLNCVISSASSPPPQVCNGSGEDPLCHDGACTLGLCTSVDDHLHYFQSYMGSGDDC
jgi:hypothetical protein